MNCDDCNGLNKVANKL